MLRNRERARRWQQASILVQDFDWGPHPLQPNGAEAWNPDQPPLLRPQLHVTNIARRAYVWKAMLGSHVGSAADWLVVNLRGSNLYQEDWKVPMSTLSQATHIFSPGCFCWTRDIKAAFLLVGFGACHPGLHSRQSMGGKQY
eukprot:1605739-Rhodomonas_salina.1